MINNVVINTSETEIVVVPSGKTYANVVLILCNTTASDRTITIYAIKNGGSVGNGTTILKELTVQAKDTFLFESKLLLAEGDKIIGVASDSNSITATASYLEI